MKYAASAKLNVRMPLREGLELATFIYLPPGEGPFPVLLIRTPYDASLTNGIFEWTERGYAYVKQDTRGRFLSDGEFISYVNEEADGAEALAWIAAQPWCNGRIAMYGGSYVAATQTTAALSGNPALRCMTPALIGTEIYSMGYSGGAFRLRGKSAKSGEAPRSPAEIEAEIFEQRKSAPPASIEGLLHPHFDEFWKTHSPVGRFGSITAPAFIRTGWFDLFVADVFELFNGLRHHGGDETTRRYTRILVGPWPHEINQRVVGEEDFGETASVADMYEQEIAFIDQFTAGKSGYDLESAPVRLFIMGTNEWRDEHEWPLARTRWTDFFLASDGPANTLNGRGRLAAVPTGDPDRFHYDPESPVPTLGGAWDFTNVGPHDQTQIESRDDVLVYTSEELSEATEVIGPIVVHLFAASSAVDTDFTAKLVDLRADGRPMSVTDGIVRAQYRHQHGPTEQLIPGDVYEFTIQCNPTAYCFKKGHQIRLEISSSNFPAFSRNRNTGEPVGPMGEMKIAQQTIFHSAKHPSRIVLPIIPQ